MNKLKARENLQLIVSIKIDASRYAGRTCNYIYLLTSLKRVN